MAVGQPPFAKAVSSPPLYISLKTERVEMKEGSEVEAGEEVAKMC
jgi:hypothetical protein